MAKKRSILHTQQLTRRKRRYKLIKVGALIVAGIAVLIGVVCLFRLPHVSITSIAVEGAVETPEAEIRAHAERMMVGKQYFIFPKRSIFFYPKAAIETSIAESYPRLEEVELTLSHWNSLRIIVRERETFGEWCNNGGEASTILSSSPCYVFDRNGYIFASMPLFSTGTSTLIRYHGTLEGNPLRQIFTPKLPFAQTSHFLSMLDPEGIIVRNIIVTEYGYELVAESGLRIFINPEQDIQKTFDNLLLILDKAAKDLTAVQTIDLRFGNKVYLKRQ